MSEEELGHPRYDQVHDQQHLLRKEPLSRIQEELLLVDQPSLLFQVVTCVLLVVFSALLGVSATYYYLSPQLLSPLPSSQQNGLHAIGPSSSSPSGASAGEGVPVDWSAGVSIDGSIDYDPAMTNGAMLAARAIYPLPGTKLVNFTVDVVALPPSRWPATIDQHSHQPSTADTSVGSITDTTDPFVVGSPQRFQGPVRGAVVSLYTPNQHQQLLGRFAENEQLFYTPMADHADVIIFYTVFPDDADLLLHDDLLLLGCRELTNATALTSREPDNSDIYARLRHPAIAFPGQLGSIREFVTTHGAHILTVPIAVNLPQHLVHDIGKVQQPNWMKCANKRWSMGYVLFSGAVFSSKLLLHPILRGYDYFVKMDLDIRFLQPIPAPSIFQSMHEQGCMWMHSQYSSRKEDCGLDGPEAVEAWAAEHQTVPASFGRKWWKSLDYFYGNFVGGWLGWVRSVENRQLATYLYENERHPGYFQHRWGDQPPFAKQLGMWFDIADGDVQGKNRTTTAAPINSQVCNYAPLRRSVFIHE